MEVHIKPETESRLTELASKSGRATDDLVEVALAGYLTEVAEVREMLDGRYDDIKSASSEAYRRRGLLFDGLRQRETGRSRDFVWHSGDNGKQPRRRRAALLALGVRPKLASNTACSSRGPWYLAHAKTLSVALPNSYFHSLGLPNLEDAS